MATRELAEIYTNPLIQGAGMAANITPTNTTSGDAMARISTGIWVGGGGDLSVVFAESIGGNGVSIANVQAGSLLPFRAVRIQATGTTATNISFLYSGV